MPHIATGDLFREAVELGTPLGLQAQRHMDAGELVPDELAVELVLERVRRPDAALGFVLDGVPRTVAQAEALDAALAALGRPLQRVVHLDVPRKEILERIARRATLGHRTDDRADVVEHRLGVYLAVTAPLIDDYRSNGVLVSIDGVGTVDEVAGRVEQALA